jgi:hypothetical protein
MRREAPQIHGDAEALGGQHGTSSPRQRGSSSWSPLDSRCSLPSTPIGGGNDQLADAESWKCYRMHNAL